MAETQGAAGRREVEGRVKSRRERTSEQPWGQQESTGVRI